MSQEHEQIIIPFKISPKENLLIKAECNNFAIRYLSSWTEIFPEAYCTILIGSKSSGKTALIEYWLKKHKSSKLLSLSRMQKSLMDEMEKYNFLAIDDIHNSKSQEKKLFHIINETIRQKKYLLMTSENNNYENYFKVPDLLSRLKSFNIITISEISPDITHQMLAKYLADHQIRVPFDIYSLINIEFQDYKHMHEFYTDLVQSIKKHRGRLTKKFIKSVISKYTG